MWIRALFLLLPWAVSPALMMPNHYYIISACNSEHPQLKSCLTLQHFAESIKIGLNDFRAKNITLLFSPGKHFLTGGVMFNGTTQVILKGHIENGNNLVPTAAEITCDEISCFLFSNVSHIHIESLTFINCTSEHVEGGAIFIQRAQFVTIVHSSFVNNTMRIRAGALRIIDSEYVYVTHSQFLNNSAICHPSDIRADNVGCLSSCIGSSGAVSVFSCGIVFIVNSLFEGNTASCIAGAISSASSTKSFTVLNTTFVRNSVRTENGLGGALLVYSDKIVQIMQTVFKENRAGLGSGLLSHNSPLNVSNVTFKRNNGSAIQMEFSTLFLSHSIFESNKGALTGGGISSISSVTLISHCLFFWNKCGTFGGATFFGDTFLFLEHTVFTNNTAFSGGAIGIENNGQSVTITNCSLMGNKAEIRNSSSSGGAVYLSLNGGSVCTILTLCDNALPDLNQTTTVKFVNSKFEHNSAQLTGGAIFASNGVLNITNCTFNANTGPLCGGAILAINSIFNFSRSNFTSNSASAFGNSVYLSNVITTSSKNSFLLNSGSGFGGVFYVINSTLSTVGDTYIGNSVVNAGGVMYAFISNIVSTNCLYLRNEAKKTGGSMIFLQSNASISRSCFHNNTVIKGQGAAIFQADGSITIRNTDFIGNIAFGPREVYTVQLTNVRGQCDGLTFTKNVGSMYLFFSNLNFAGQILFTENTAVTSYGGALSSVQSTLVFEESSRVIISNNVARYGGGSSIFRSTFTVHTSSFTVDNNTALISGGGVYSYQSEINIKTSFGQEPLLFQRNIATNGGAIHSVSSTINTISGHVLFTTNDAYKGGAVFLSQSSNIYIQKTAQEFVHDLILVSLTFSNNTAEYGGALYVLDASNTGVLCGLTPSTMPAARSTGECFLQTLRLYYPHDRTRFNESNYINIFFESNFGTTAGNDIFGGLLDRCRSNSFAEIYNNFNVSSEFSAFNYITSIAQFQIDVDYDQLTWPFDPQNITEIITTEFVSGLISSSAMQVCFCINRTHDCTYQHPTIFRKKGEYFSVLLATVDQVQSPVNGIVRARVISSGTTLKVDQSRQQLANGVCTELVYNVFSTQVNAIIQLYPDGPCDNVGISSKELNISFLPCECPNGLQPAPIDNDCQCECDSSLDAIVSQCSLLDSGNLNIVRRTEHNWIQYINNDSTTGFVYSECPSDYCLVEPVNLSFILPSQVDTQCAYNRSGVLCGECEEGLSLVFGSSRCVLCSNNYLALLIAFMVAGIGLVAIILILNLTVAVGTTHGLILYANIVSANSPTFLPGNINSVLHLFVSWVNLDLGIETCFYDGMNSYAKVLLQLVFPTYVISLSALIIVVSFYWGRFAALIGRKNPVATLCTLFLLSYSKLLQTIIASLQYAQLTYPNGVTEILWLYNPNIPYFTPSRIPKFIIAGVIIVLGTIYTILLFFGQWLRKLQRFKCLRSTKYNAFIDAYHAPFSFKHRYWVGILLLIRIIHHLLTAILSESSHLLIVSCLMCTLLIFKTTITNHIFKSWLIDFLETSFLINLLLFAVTTYYVSLTNRDQVAVTNTSVITAFITFCLIILFHTHTYFLKSFSLYSKLSVSLQHCFRTIKQRTQFHTVNRGTGIVAASRDLRQTRYIMREPALDILAPITPGDYAPPTCIPSAAPRTLPVTTSTVIVVRDREQQTTPTT